MASAKVEHIIRSQRALERKRWLVVIGFLALSIIGLVFDIVTGPSMLPLEEVVRALLRLDDVETTTSVIVYDLRLPMALMALVVGAALGVGGAEIQTLLNNPMASPYTLGLAAAAGLGASAVIAFGGFGLPSAFAVPAGAFVMTILASAILFVFASMRRFSSAMLVLVGIALLFLFQSMLSLIQFIAAPEISQQILFWLFGSLTKSTWEHLIIAAVVTSISVFLLSKDVWKLTALRLGEERALSLGINLQLLRLKTLIIVAVMTATAISFVGIIGFIGLVAPHVARMLLGEDQRFFLPGAMLVGAAFLSIASVLSKIIIPGALFPVGIITSFVGVPFFFWIVLSKRG
ncbi:iron complex transport system permease protein [Mesocricetibacter intestinalis]|uniref:Iron complex transport system permease protein n=1 Tax=Mesocricetibacter intestinalis TaxID=1521930 RepID=A0A4R6V843_9PAST|nr:iron ABC transporter permease [Mesocricetibacter intestinalis]TDQ57395.1 iron complex transport system permease protein [Mesocricetibacter intestinalis]